jgi:hypothetical protein
MVRKILWSSSDRDLRAPHLRGPTWIHLIRGTVNNFVEWPHSVAVMHCSEYMEPRDSAVSVLLSSQEEAVVCVLCIHKECHCSFLRAAKSRMSHFEHRKNVNFCQNLGHILPTYLISHHAISFSFPAWKKSYMGVASKYISAVFPAAIPTLADLHSGQRRLFWGRMWKCVSVCEYLVIWCEKKTQFTKLLTVVVHPLLNRPVD